MRKKVFVAMSGGVDSSAAAFLLLEMGYNVCGITMKLLPGELSDSTAVKDAQEAAKLLGIPHYICDLQDVFQRNVIDYFCQEYMTGRTPNPCIICNQTIKFRALFDYTRTLGADYLATGHYVRVNYDDQRRRWVLKKGIDAKKDQSYVLFTLQQDILPYLKFPLGEYRKDEVRQTTARAGFQFAGKKESQEICFIPDDDYCRFLLESSPQAAEPGIIYDLQGNPIGEHRGVAFYTIGQRRGLGIALGYPAYVVEIDPVGNALVVGKREDLMAHGLTARDVNLIAVESLQKPIPAKVKIRYAASPAEAEISPGEEGEIIVRFSQPQKAVTPGQAVVFYEDDLVLGGGIIHKPIR